MSEVKSYIDGLKSKTDDELMDVWALTNPNVWMYNACHAEVTRREFRGQAAVLEAQRQAAEAETLAAEAANAMSVSASKNAKYMLWSVVAAAASAIFSAVGVAISAFGHQ
jgi:hypothetical protein